jgi:AcrR family transcriptional regulator
MMRWQPGSRERLGEAAMELFSEQGYENTTVADIAERAGLTERTFFRYFADKREVLFGGGGELQELIVSAVAQAPAGAGPIDAAAAGVEAGAALLQERRAFARQRQKIIAATPELREREIMKLASIAAALAGALRERGVDDPTATLTAEIAIAVFRIAFERWVAGSERRGFPELIRESLDDLGALTKRPRRERAPASA